MKQILQNNKTGKLIFSDIPIPVCRSEGIIVHNIASLVSVGTEKQMIDFARKNLLEKAKARPDLVKQVINKIKTDGIMETYHQVMSRLDSPMPLGYSSAGVVAEVGVGLIDAGEFKTGNRVACSGSGYACHAEVVSVPKNLCVRIPDNVSFDNAAFSAIGGIALHALRMVEPTLGENIAIIGLGLLGQIAIQIIKASGCNAIGIDIDPKKVELAQELGADVGIVNSKIDVSAQVASFTSGIGADAVIIMASTSGNEPIQLAAEIVRERGRIIATGLVGLDVPRKIFYEKELDFKVSRAWGPGMYDEEYERGKTDYPLPYVRWTAKRNMEQFLNLLSQGKVKLDKLVTHRFPIERALEAYEMIMDGKEPYIAVLLEYKTKTEYAIGEKDRFVVLHESPIIKHNRMDHIRIGLIGAGQFAKGTILPALKKIDFVKLRGVATASGISAKDVGDKFGFDYCTSDYIRVLEDPEVDCVLIATRHNLHAKLVSESLKHGKDVFVEKPLALNDYELDEIIEVINKSGKRLMVGFNRRFSPLSVKAKELLSFSKEPMIINFRINAGFVPKDSWIQSSDEGGGRIIGEICHFVDLIQYFTEAIPSMVYAETISGQNESYTNSDNIAVSVKMDDGSIASIVYASNGDKAFPRERIEIFRDGAVCLIDNFRSMSFIRNGKRIHKSNFNVDRGYNNEFQIFFSCIKEGKMIPVDFKEYVVTTLATFSIVDSINKRIPVDINMELINQNTSYE